MPVLPFVVAGGLLTALLFAAGGEDKPEPKPDEPKPKPPPEREAAGPVEPPGLQDAEWLRAFDTLLCECYATVGAGTTVAQLRLCMAPLAYPSVPSWPPVEGDDATVFQVWEFMGTRIGAFLAGNAGARAAWCPPPVPPPQPPGPGPQPFEPPKPAPEPTLEPLEILVGMTATTPTVGRFFLIGSDPNKSGEPFSWVLRAALNRVVPGAGDSADNRHAYAQIITSGPRWNWPLYASTAGPTANFPASTFVGGRSLRRAWDPWHANAKNAVAAGKAPARMMDLAGKRVGGGNQYGLLWLPPVNVDFLKEGVVSLQGLDWNDGSSVIDPPPELVDKLTPA
jgi:hypothetical protein